MKKVGKSLLILLASAMLIGFAGCKPEIKYVEKEVEKAVFVCPKCQKSYDTVQKAADCCGVQTIEKEVKVYKYVCPKDKKEFATAQEAADCCGVQIEYVDKEVEKIVKKYVCPRDGKEFDTAAEAENCCGPIVEEKLVYTTAVKAGIYTVYHFQQNISGGKAFENYTLYATEKSKLVVRNSTLDDLKKNYAGFTSKALAQNETALYVFYDRNIITYTFQTGNEGKLNDGTTERIVEGLYGANVPIPIARSSTHYFEGWFTTSNAVPGDVYGKEDLTFTVKWTPKTTGGFNWYETPVDAETGNTATPASKYIYFGVFPKSVLPQESKISIDETKTKIMGANTYYKGNDGNYYAKVTVNPHYTSQKYSDRTTVTADTTRYFKVEPIKWKVLTVDYNGTRKALLLAEDILTANVPYYVEDSNRNIGDNIVYPNNYKYSTIRAFLNGAYETEDEQTRTYEEKGFLQTAFTSYARLLIAETEVDNRAETSGFGIATYENKYFCENTTDKVFLLSRSEVINETYGLTEKARIHVTTDYAKANNGHQSITVGYGGDWLLRSPNYYSSNSACNVYYDGNVGRDTFIYNMTYGVVPALSISLY